MGFFKRLFGQEKKESLDQGLAKSKQGVMERISRVFTGRRRIDDDLLDDLEEALILSDAGVDTTEAILGRLRKRATWEAYVDQGELMTMLREEVLGLITKDDDRISIVFCGARPPRADEPRPLPLVVEQARERPGPRRPLGQRPGRRGRRGRDRWHPGRRRWRARRGTRRRRR